MALGCHAAHLYEWAVGKVASGSKAPITSAHVYLCEVCAGLAHPYDHKVINSPEP